MGTFRVQLYKTLKAWQVAETLAQKTLSKVKGYTSKRYAINSILTNDNKFGLIELKGFEKQLLKAGFKFQDLDKSIIKVEEI